MADNNITWSQAIVMAIIQLGYIATLKDIYRLAPTFKQFKGKTPDKTINERVQRDPAFVKLKPGLYGLRDYMDKVPDEFNPNVAKTEEEEMKITHSIVQGMLIEVGNINGLGTYSPDKGAAFVRQKLGDMTTIKDVPEFTYSSIIKSTKYIDVIWFNERNFPHTLFEVENSTNFRNSLVKFVELQDFNTRMFIVAPKNESKLNKFKQEIEKSAFSTIRTRVKLYDYESVEKLYESQIEASKYADILK